MKQYLNTLYVTTDGTYLAKKGDTVLVRIDGKTMARLPLINLEGIVAMGRIGASPALLGACADAGVSVSFLSTTGRLRARVLGFSPGNVLLRRAQYRVADDESACGRIVSSIVRGKIVAARQVLLRSARDCDDASSSEAIRRVAKQLKSRLRRASCDASTDRLRGIEGEAASLYFGVFDQCIRPGELRFDGRKRRPPPDPVNALLSFVYTLLSHDVRSGCESVGLDSQVGFLHRDRPGRPGLALDLMEEFRSALADRMVLTLINRGQVNRSDFRNEATGRCVMTDAARKEVISAWQNRKRETVRHPYLEETVPIGLLFFVQAQLLARHLRGDLDAYPPMFWK